MEELPGRAEDAPAGAPGGGAGGLGGRGREGGHRPRRLLAGPDPPGLEGHRLAPFTTRVEETRSCSPLPENATIRKPIPRLAAERR